MGGIGLRINESHETAELGYALAKGTLGARAFMPEAARAVITPGDSSGTTCTRSTPSPTLRNRRSWRVMEKLGMTREGVLRGHPEA